MQEKKTEELSHENEQLRERLREAEETLRAIRYDGVDAFVISKPQGNRVYTLSSAGRSYSALLETISEGTVIVAPEDTVFSCNGRFSEMLKAPPENLTGTPFITFIAPHDHDRFKSLFQRAKDEHVRGEMHLQAGDGALVPVQLSINSLEVEEMPGSCIVVTDLSRQKRIEESLRRANRAFKTLSQCNQALVHEKEEEGLLRRVCRIIVSTGGYRMAWVGYAENDAQKKVRPLAQAGFEDGYLETAGITWADEERGRGATGTAIRTGKHTVNRDIPTDPEFAPWRAEALKRGYSSTIALPLMADDKVFGALVIYAAETDAFNEEEIELLVDLADNLSYGITAIRMRQERRRAEEELKIYMEKLEHSNRELQDFAFVASHDLQEPLRKVQVFGSFLKDRFANALEKEGMDYLNRMLSATNRMNSLLHALLSYSRVTTRAEPPVKVDLNLLVQEVLVDLEVRLRQTGGQVEIEDLPTLEADPSQMRQLFQNLIGNALKFHGEEKPLIRIYSRNDSSPDLPGKQICRIYVEDNGIGFDEAYRDRIFNPFERLHGRSQYEGTGMGLAICKKIVERHNGQITVKSAVGKGSTFIISLPCDLQ